MAADRKHPFIIAGPCSAETEQQLVSAASALSAARVSAFRAGIWKPRTHPGNFEGVGVKGLAWLARIRRDFGIEVCTEVALPSHVEACLEAGIDMLWLGARTVANPFLVQEISEALKGSAVPVWVKNPLAPDMELWAGAVERLLDSGVNVIGLIHRGVPGNGRTVYRNRPEWGAAIGMKCRFPEMKMLCDSSHIAGDAAYVREISTRALGLGFDGLMVEVHPDPASALSDSAQQLTPAQFADMMSGISVRGTDSGNGDYRSELARLRTVIDRIDSDIVSLLAERLEASREIGELKKRNNVAILQTDRWNQVLESRKALGEERGVDPALTERIFSLIHEASVLKQEG